MTDSEATPGETYVSTAPETSVLGSGSSGGSGGSSGSEGKSSKRGLGSKKGRGADDRKKHAKSHPWRDNIEAVAISIVTIVLFKYFVLEAYKIPTGSMQPTLMGNEETGIYDRVIVDKFSFHFRDPERFEIAVFKYPLDSSKNFIKRIVGMPGERLFLRNGDAWVQKDGESKPKVLRRSRAIQNVQLRELDSAGEWRPDLGAKDWVLDSRDSGTRIQASGGGSVSFPRTYESVRDDYLDGYPKGMKSKVKFDRKGSNANNVTDLRLRFEARAEAGCREIVAVLHEGRREFRFILPGPGAPADATARVEITGLDASGGPWELSKLSAEAFRLSAGDSVKVEVQNLNDLLALRIDGDEVLTLEVPPIEGRSAARASIEVDAPEGSGATLEKIRVWRDIYYTSDARQKVTEWQIPEGHYVVLGDNSQDSSDGRDWSFAQFRLLEDGISDGDNKDVVIRGNERESMVPRPDTNPRYVPARPNEEKIFFTDELGERHVFDKNAVERLSPDVENASFVPRELIRGRAVIVVWPLAPQHDVYRWKWVR